MTVRNLLLVATSALLAAGLRGFAGASLLAHENDEGHRRSIASISVCEPSRAGAPKGNCPTGSADDAREVLGPDGTSINGWGGMDTLADEHSTIFAPGTLPGHHGRDYLLFAAARTAANSTSSGVVVLTGGSGPAPNGQWTLDFAPEFGRYFPLNPAGSRNAQIFLSPVYHDLCPSAAHAKDQDQTFDLNYADPGSILVDPTGRANHRAGAVFMVYEGTTRCIGIASGSNSGNGFYSTTGIATSLDGGITWPAYKADAVQLPLQSADGPKAPFGALGSQVCMGGDCQSTPPAAYGRYAAVGPPGTIGAAMQLLGPKNLSDNLGDSQPAAFVDDVHRTDGGRGEDGGTALPYVYVVNVYNPGPAELGNPALATVNFDLVVARAQLNGGTAPLQFSSWHDGAFSSPGLGPAGGLQSPIFAVQASSDPVAYSHCLDPTEKRMAPSISYVEETHEYLLTFMCFAPSDPLSGQAGGGGAWFYSTLDGARYDLSHQDRWSLPREIVGSWSAFDTGGACVADFRGWYPSFMSMGEEPGRLSSRGYVFYMAGCADKLSKRTYSSRAFMMTIE